MDCETKNHNAIKCNTSNQKSYILQDIQDTLEDLLKLKKKKLNSTKVAKYYHLEEVKKFRHMNQNVRQAKILANTELFRIQSLNIEKTRKNDEVLECKDRYQKYKTKLKQQVNKALNAQREYEKEQNQKEEYNKAKREKTEQNIKQLKDKIDYLKNELFKEKKRAEFLEYQRKEQLIKKINHKKRSAKNYYEGLRRSKKIQTLKRDIGKLQENIKHTKEGITEMQRRAEQQDNQVNLMKLQQINGQIKEQFKLFGAEYQDLNKKLDEIRRKYYFAKEFYRVEKKQSDNLSKDFKDKKVRNQNFLKKSDRLWMQLAEIRFKIQDLEKSKKMCKDCLRALQSDNTQPATLMCQEYI